MKHGDFLSWHLLMNAWTVSVLALCNIAGLVLNWAIELFEYSEDVVGIEVKAQESQY